MDELTSIACSMTYTDMRRRLIKAYQAHSAGLNPDDFGDKHLERKLSAKLGSYGPNGFILLMRELAEDIPELHPVARRDLAEYAIYLRGLHEADVELGPAPTMTVTPVGRPDYTPFSVPTTHAMNIEPAA